MSVSIAVVYSVRAREVLELALAVPSGCTVGQVMQRGDIGSMVGDADMASLTVGVWGRRVTSAHVLHDQDRLEIYRPLTVDPKVARRERFVRQGAKKAAGLFAKRRDGAKAGY